MAKTKEVKEVKEVIEVRETPMPTFTLSADNDFGMRAIIALSRWANEDYRISPEDRKALRIEVRKFELWREENK